MRKNHKQGAVFAFAAMTAIGFLLRRMQLANGYDADALPLPAAGLWLGVFSAAAAALAVLCCLRLAERPGFAEAFSFSVPTAVLSVAGAGLIFAGCVIAFRASGDGLKLEKIAALLGAVSALCIAATQSAQRKAAAPNPLIGMLPVVFCILRLIGDFRQWSTDPILLDYWVKLFAMLAILLAAYYLAGFCFNRGKRRAAAVFCLLAVYFSGLCLADVRTDFTLIVGGSMLWQGACAWQLLRSDEAPAEASIPET